MASRSDRKRARRAAEQPWRFPALYFPALYGTCRRAPSTPSETTVVSVDPGIGPDQTGIAIVQSDSDGFRVLGFYQRPPGEVRLRLTPKDGPPLDVTVGEPIVFEVDPADLARFDDALRTDAARDQLLDEKERSAT